MRAVIDLTHQKFGRLQPIRQFSENKRSFWLCFCDCGQTTKARAESLKSGNTTSCGCYQAEIRITHGRTHTPEYRSWDHMIQRCHNPMNGAFKDYGQRGIVVCDDWRNSFEAFLSDMGPRPTSKHSIDRKDCNGNYELSNCRWATRDTQANNTRRNNVVKYHGTEKTLTQWARDLGISYDCVYGRLRRGWSIEDAFNLPHTERER